MRTGGKSSEHDMKGDDMRCTFRVDPQQFWIGNLSKLKKIKFGNDNDVAFRVSEEFILETRASAPSASSWPSTSMASRSAKSPGSTRATSASAASAGPAAASPRCSGR